MTYTRKHVIELTILLTGVHIWLCFAKNATLVGSPKSVVYVPGVLITTETLTVK